MRGADWKAPDVARKTERAEPAVGVAGDQDERTEADSGGAGIRIDLADQRKIGLHK